MSSSRRIHREFTPEERARWKELVALVEQDKDEILSAGRKHKAASLVRRELHETMRLLDEAREKLGLSLADLTERTGIARGNLSRLFSNEANPTIQTVARVADALGLQLVVGLEPKRAGKPARADKSKALR